MHTGVLTKPVKITIRESTKIFAIRFKFLNNCDLIKYCLSLKGTDEALPLDNKTLVFSVKGKVFCATDPEDFELINLQYD